jgi:hypothetical protein
MLNEISKEDKKFNDLELPTKNELKKEKTTDFLMILTMENIQEVNLQVRTNRYFLMNFPMIKDQTK